MPFEYFNDRCRLEVERDAAMATTKEISSVT